MKTRENRRSTHCGKRRRKIDICDRIKNNRVMTIQKSDTGSEFGIVGFKEHKGASYLIFPKSLKRFENKRIVAINWDLVKTR